LFKKGFTSDGDELYIAEDATVSDAQSWRVSIPGDDTMYTAKTSEE
jgi:hypothetical protein